MIQRVLFALWIVLCMQPALAQPTKPAVASDGRLRSERVLRAVGVGCDVADGARVVARPGAARAHEQVSAGLRGAGRWVGRHL